MKTGAAEALSHPDARGVPTLTLVAALAALLVGLLWAAAVFFVMESRAEIRQDAGLQKLGWREMAWPLPRDAWPAGRAFRCRAASCGEGSELFIRAKPGLCNCDTGVADDAEVDRVSDIDLIGPRVVPAASGQAVRFGAFAGRARSYVLDPATGSRPDAIGVALSRRCDMMVAVIKGSVPEPLLRDAVGQFIDAAEVQRWMTAAAGGK